jgi:TolB-like protein/DNA-binding winged helix-turn-helix (wHTH) protein/Tfp pilus assembly protein PilF
MDVMQDVRVVPSTERLQIGSWTVDSALNQLSAAGKSVKLEPKAMAVLLYLANRPGEVVSRETLLEAAWPGVIVVDDALTQVVIKLRKALGDSPDAPSYIQTIAKRGYRLVAPVARGPQLAAAQNVAGRDRATDHRPGRTAWIAAMGVTAALVAAALWWIKGDRAADPPRISAASQEVVRAAQPTIAIKPFEALSNDPTEVLLARGVTEDLVTDLSKLSGLSVIGFAPMESRSDAESVHPPMRYLVTGSVQRIDRQLRLHVHLADVETGKQLWSERYDRPLADLFAIQDELGPKILQVLPAKVSKAEMQRLAQRHTRNLEAYEYFQRGQAALLIRQRAENETARKMFRHAIELDAAFARAFAGLALTYAADYRNQWTANGEATLDRAYEMARTAHQMNPDIPETYWALAYVNAQRRQHQQALQDLETAVRLYPSFADGYALMGSVSTFVGRPADTIPLLRTAMRLNPTAGYLYFLVLGRAYLFLGDLEQARINLEQALARNPESLEAHIYMAATHASTGNKAAAAWETEEIRMLQPGFSSSLWLKSYPMTDAAQQARLAKLLTDVGL